MNLEKLEKNVKLRGFDFFHAATAEEAVQHVLEQVQNTSVGIGGSTTVDQIGLYDRLKENNEVHWHWKDGNTPEVWRAAAVPGFAFRRVFDLRLGWTLRRWGVDTFYTRNRKDFRDCGFTMLVDPFED